MEGLAVGHVAKLNLGNRVAAMIKDFMNAQKEVKANEIKEATAKLGAIFNDSKVEVASLACPVHGNTKTLVTIFESLSSLENSVSAKPVLLYGLEENGRFHFLLSHPKAASVIEPVIETLGLKHYKPVKVANAGILVGAASINKETDKLDVIVSSILGKL